MKDRCRGTLIGLAVGDALGAAVEFKPPGSFKPVTGSPRIDYLGFLGTGYGNRPYKGSTAFVRLLYFF